MRTAPPCWAAALATAGRIDARLGLFSAFLGIWIGDLGLYSLGSVFGRRLLRSRFAHRFLTPEKLEEAETWFAGRGPATLAMSRFVPGSRLPLYLAAGTLRFSAQSFALITGICSALWVTAIFVLWRFVPRPAFGSGPAAPRLLAVGGLFGPWLLSRGAVRIWQRVGIIFRKYRRWEFWPAWLFYPPVAAMCVWFGLRYGGLSLPTVANPSCRNGGIVGESKIKVLQALMSTTPEAVADAYLIPAGALAERQRMLADICGKNAIAYPCVLKPNLGQRGTGFNLISNHAEAARYLERVQSDVILERYVSGPREAGIFYYRFPGQERGQIFAVTEKVFPGAASEATNIYDERNSLFSAYRTLYRQWKLVYAIGGTNRDLGHKSAPVLDLLRDWNLYRTISAAYPAAD